MFRHIAVLTFGLAAIANLNAGYIQIGGNTGLTSSSGTTEVPSGSTSGEMPYNTTLFQGVASPGYTSGTLCAGATQSTCAPTTGVPSGEPGNEFASANGVTFAMINENLTQTNENVWAATNTAGTVGSPQVSTITIPIGIFGVTDVDTMLNDQFGLVGATDTTVQFVFSNPAFNETFSLVNGTVIRDDYDCTSVSGCPTYATNLNTANMYDINGNSLGPISATSVAHVTAFNVWSGTYSSVAGAYANTSGNLYLDAQDFYLGSAASTVTLNDVIITDTNTAKQQSRVALSAVTVETTPEPSTILLIVSGVGAVGLIRRRRKA